MSIVQEVQSNSEIDMKHKSSREQTFVTSEKKSMTFVTSKDLPLLYILNFSTSVTKALPTTKEKMCASTNLKQKYVIGTRRIVES